MTSVRAEMFHRPGTVVDFGSRAPAVAFRDLVGQWGVAFMAAQARAATGLPKRDHIRAPAGRRGRTGLRPGDLAAGRPAPGLEEAVHAGSRAAGVGLAPGEVSGLEAGKALRLKDAAAGLLSAIDAIGARFGEGKQP